MSKRTVIVKRAAARRDQTDAAIRKVVDALPSEHSRRGYRRALEDFFHWHRGAGRPQLNESVNKYD